MEKYKAEKGTQGFPGKSSSAVTCFVDCIEAWQMRQKGSKSQGSNFSNTSSQMVCIFQIHLSTVSFSNYSKPQFMEHIDNFILRGSLIDMVKKTVKGW